jgi:hypothetical protein
MAGEATSPKLGWTRKEKKPGSRPSPTRSRPSRRPARRPQRRRRSRGRNRPRRERVRSARYAGADEASALSLPSSLPDAVLHLSYPSG